MEAMGALVRKESLGGSGYQKSGDRSMQKKKPHTKPLVDVQRSLMSDRDGLRKLSCGGGNAMRRWDQSRTAKIALRNNHWKFDWLALDHFPEGKRDVQDGVWNIFVQGQNA